MRRVGSHGPEPLGVAPGSRSTGSHGPSSSPSLPNGWSPVRGRSRLRWPTLRGKDGPGWTITSPAFRQARTSGVVPAGTRDHRGGSAAPAAGARPMDWTPPPDGVAICQDGTWRFRPSGGGDTQWNRLASSVPVRQSRAVRHTARGRMGRWPAEEARPGKGVEGLEAWGDSCELRHHGSPEPESVGAEALSA